MPIEILQGLAIPFLGTTLGAACVFLLRGELDSYAAIGSQKLELGGYMPNLDHLNKILGLVPRYLR